MQNNMFIGPDVHKATIFVAVARGKRGGEVRHWGTAPHRPDHVRKLVEKLSASGARLRFCYEAGPCGYGLHRQLVEMGHDCIVVAPSLIPLKAGDRTVACRRWLTTVRFDHPAQQTVFQDYVDAVADAQTRVAKPTGQIAELLPDWDPAPVVEAVQAMRGVGFIVAVTVVAEVGDFRRFGTPRQLIAYLGLASSEHSSGSSVRRGGITKAGSGLARRALIERAWSYRMQARVSPKLLARLEALPQAVRDIAWKGQLGMCQRSRHLVAAGKAKVVVVTAIAREMAGFIWAIAKMVTAAPAHTAGQDAWRKGHSSGRPMRRVGGGTR